MNKILLFAMLGFLLSCEKHVYTESYEMEKGWDKNTQISYNFEIENANDPYNIYFVVRNNNNYPFSNLILFTDLDGEIDTLNFTLADESGKWLGTGLGSLKEITFEIKNNYKFKKAGLQHLKVRQAMRKDTLYGIEDLSVIVDNKSLN